MKRDDLNALLQQLTRRVDTAKALWTKQYLTFEGDDPPNYTKTPLHFALIHEDFSYGSSYYMCGWQWRPYEATRWTIWATGATPLAAAEALEQLLNEGMATL